jgi:predicted P-loop ATPase
MGEQGCGKSTLVRFLAINDMYYGEVTTVDGQPAIEQLSGKWICEMSEMLALTKAKEQEAVKAFITRTIDSYRKPWDKNVSDLPRRVILISTTNDFQVLVDKTGNRRFYPIEVHSNGYEIYAHEDEIREYILQCWAEARDRYKARKMPNYANQSLVGLYREAQENAMQDDWRVGAIKLFLEKKDPGEFTCVREVCHRALSSNPDFPKEPTLAESKDIGRILNKMKGWERINGSRKVGAYGVQRCWRKKGEQVIEKTDKPFWED